MGSSAGAGVPSCATGDSLGSATAGAASGCAGVDATVSTSTTGLSSFWGGSSRGASGGRPAGWATIRSGAVDAGAVDFWSSGVEELGEVAVLATVGFAAALPVSAVLFGEVFFGAALFGTAFFAAALLGAALLAGTFCAGALFTVPLVEVLRVERAGAGLFEGTLSVS